MAKKSLKDTFVNQLIDELAEEGFAAINLAYRHRDFTNRTYNLHDSYGSAVYYNGKLIKRTVRYVGEEKNNNDTGYFMGTNWRWRHQKSLPDFRGDRYWKDDPIRMTGRTEVMDFFSEYTPPKKGLQLVVVAAMWYANVLEEGGGNLKRKYRVISGARSALDKIVAEIGGNVTQIETGRVLTQQHTLKDSSWKQ